MTEGSFSFWSNYSDVDVIKNKFYSKIQLILKRDVVSSNQMNILIKGLDLLGNFIDNNSNNFFDVTLCWLETIYKLYERKCKHHYIFPLLYAGIAKNCCKIILADNLPHDFLQKFLYLWSEIVDEEDNDLNMEVLEKETKSLKLVMKKIYNSVGDVLYQLLILKVILKYVDNVDNHEQFLTSLYSSEKPQVKSIVLKVNYDNYETMFPVLFDAINNSCSHKNGLSTMALHNNISNRVHSQNQLWINFGRNTKRITCITMNKGIIHFIELNNDDIKFVKMIKSSRSVEIVTNRGYLEIKDCMGNVKNIVPENLIFSYEPGFVTYIEEAFQWILNTDFKIKFRDLKYDYNHQEICGIKDKQKEKCAISSLSSFKETSPESSESNYTEVQYDNNQEFMEFENNMNDNQNNDKSKSISSDDTSSNLIIDIDKFSEPETNSGSIRKSKIEKRGLECDPSPVSVRKRIKISDQTTDEFDKLFANLYPNRITEVEKLPNKRRLYTHKFDMENQSSCSDDSQKLRNSMRSKCNLNESSGNQSQLSAESIFETNTIGSKAKKMRTEKTLQSDTISLFEDTTSNVPTDLPSIAKDKRYNESLQRIAQKFFKHSDETTNKDPYKLPSPVVKTAAVTDKEKTNLVLIPLRNNKDYLVPTFTKEKRKYKKSLAGVSSTKSSKRNPKPKAAAKGKVSTKKSKNLNVPDPLLNETETDIVFHQEMDGTKCETRRMSFVEERHATNYDTNSISKNTILKESSRIVIQSNKKSIGNRLHYLNVATVIEKNGNHEQINNSVAIAEDHRELSNLSRPDTSKWIINKYFDSMSSELDAATVKDKSLAINTPQNFRLNLQQISETFENKIDTTIDKLYDTVQSKIDTFNAKAEQLLIQNQRETDEFNAKLKRNEIEIRKLENELKLKRQKYSEDLNTFANRIRDYTDKINLMKDQLTKDFDTEKKEFTDNEKTIFEEVWSDEVSEIKKKLQSFVQGILNSLN